MSSIARQYIHISYTDVFNNVFIVTNFTLNIFFNHLLFLTNNSHITLSSQCIRSHSIEKHIQVLSRVQSPFLMCLFLCVFYCVCVCALFVHRSPYNLDLCRATTGLESKFYLFFFFLNLLFQKQNKSDLVTKSQTTGESTRCASRRGRKEEQSLSPPLPAVASPRKKNPKNLATPGHDHTEQEQQNLH